MAAETADTGDRAVGVPARSREEKSIICSRQSQLLRAPSYSRPPIPKCSGHTCIVHVPTEDGTFAQIATRTLDNGRTVCPQPNGVAEYPVERMLLPMAAPSHFQNPPLVSPPIPLIYYSRFCFGSVRSTHFLPWLLYPSYFEGRGGR